MTAHSAAFSLPWRVSGTEREAGPGREVMFTPDDAGLLVDEILHRTRNTLQLAVTILDEHIDRSRDSLARTALRDAKRQIVDLVRTHDLFFAPHGADLRAYLRRLGAALCGPFQHRIRLTVDGDSVALPPRSAVIVGLVFQELVTNALKHAFGDGSGTITAELRVDDATCRLSIRDDGRGFVSPGRKSSTGLRRVRAFAAVLGGRMDVRAARGAAVSVSFPLPQA